MNSAVPHRAPIGDAPSPVPVEFVEAAVRAAHTAGQGVADVPVAVIAAEAGISRSTLLRRLGGTRHRLDEAVRASGVDPGGRVPVRARAIDAAAALLEEVGLASVTMEAVAERAACSVEGLYAVFGTRDELLAITFDQHSPLHDIEQFFDAPHGGLEDTVRGLYASIATALDRQPRTMPALLAEALSRPNSPTTQTILTHGAPRLLAALGGWLSAEIVAGHVRPLPLPILIQYFGAPFLVYTLLQPTIGEVSGLPLPDTDGAIDIFATTFLRAVGTTTTDD